MRRAVSGKTFRHVVQAARLRSGRIMQAGRLHHVPKNGRTRRMDRDRDLSMKDLSRTRAIVVEISTLISRATGRARRRFT